MEQAVFYFSEVVFKIFFLFSCFLKYFESIFSVDCFFPVCVLKLYHYRKGVTGYVKSGMYSRKNVFIL